MEGETFQSANNNVSPKINQTFTIQRKVRLD